MNGRKRPLILAVNDDGVTAKGLKHLVECMQEIGDVVVVAPDSPQSGMGHAITVFDSLRLEPVDLFPGAEAYQCSGTPADCVKLAKHHVLKDNKPDLVVSGINHGANYSVSILYSGTMSAAIEAAMEGIPAIGFSLCDYNENASFDHALPFVKQIAKKAIANGLPIYTALNVNFPSKQAASSIQGVKICRQAKARWQEVFDKRTDPHGKDYYWLSGEFIRMDAGPETDLDALDAGYASVVPCTFDLTDYAALKQIDFLNDEKQ